MRNGELYKEKANRDSRAKELKAAGFTVKRSSVMGQRLHPQHVEDRKDSLSEADKGFGNTLYRTFFAVLYRVE